jgi:hypothetical protein
VTDPQNGGRLYVFSVNVEPAPGRFWRTSLAKLSSAFVIVNQTGSTAQYRHIYNADSAIAYRQEKTIQDEEWVINKGEQIPFHWQSSSLPKLLQISPSEGSSVSGDTIFT